MNRSKFIRTCCSTVIGIPLSASLLQGCESLLYAASTVESNGLIVAKSEFLINSKKVRKFVMVKLESMDYPICIYRTGMDDYVASLMKCTHKFCELNVGGGMYSCPCHGSEFSVEGQVLEGPAVNNLKTFQITKDDENIYIQIG